MRVTAPARVCLYGEHQDYLELKVIPAAVNIFLEIEAKKENAGHIVVKSRAIGESVIINLDNINYPHNHLKTMEGYLKAGIISVKDYFSIESIEGFEAHIQSDIPIAGGLSSSAALLAAWIKLLTELAGINTTPEDIAEAAYHAEHDILGVPCGRMDQYAVSLGTVFSMDCVVPPIIKRLNFPDLNIVIVNSMIEKFTSDVHSKKAIELKNVVDKYEKIINKSIHEATFDDLEMSKIKSELSEIEYQRLQGIISIKESTIEAEEELLKSKFDIIKLGDIMTGQQRALSKNIGVSTPLLDRIVEKGISFGALGGKLTGAGLGGCVILLVEREKAPYVASSIKKEFNLPIWIASISDGLTVSK